MFKKRIKKLLRGRGIITPTMILVNAITAAADTSRVMEINNRKL